jgi:hypothetical protein
LLYLVSEAKAMLQHNANSSCSRAGKEGIRTENEGLKRSASLSPPNTETSNNFIAYESEKQKEGEMNK